MNIFENLIKLMFLVAFSSSDRDNLFSNKLLSAIRKIYKWTIVEIKYSSFMLSLPLKVMVLYLILFLLTCFLEHPQFSEILTDTKALLVSILFMLRYDRFVLTD